MSNYKKILYAICAIFVVGIAFSFYSPHNTVAQSEQDKLEELKKQIEEYEQEVLKLKNQANTLSNQIAQYDAQIRLTTLKISQTIEKIDQLGFRIDALETSIESLTEAFASRAVKTYKMSRLQEPYLLLVSAQDLPKAVSSYHYLQKIQEADRDLLTRLASAQDRYEVEKDEQEVLQEELETQKASLDAQKAAKNSLLVATKNDEIKYQELLADAKKQLSALRRFVSSQGGATILQNQTKCDSWGCYYNQRDSQWGNIGMGGSNYSVAEFGCLITSISMIASHRGKDITPDDIAINQNYFVPGTGYLYHSAEGMPFTVRSVSKNNLDSELANGPVIAGLYSGPDHFIVILKKEGENYIMHDPFMPEGGNRPLTDKYSVSDITSLRLVNFH